jgi:hypothetical protein
MGEMGVGVEVLLAIPGKGLSLSLNSGSDEVGADLIEEPVRLGLPSENGPEG